MFWFTLEATELSFREAAPFRFVVARHIDAPAEAVFEAFRDVEQLARWILGFRSARWLTGPAGIGARRELLLYGAGFRERFLSWQPGVGLSFAIEEMRLPLMKRMLEEVRIDPAPGGAEVVWTVYYEPGRLIRAIHPLARGALTAGYWLSLRRLDRLLRSPAAARESVAKAA